MIGKRDPSPLDAAQAAPPPAGRAQPLAESSDATWAAVAGVLTDIDDTLTADGRLQPQARQALQALHDAGLPVIAITGRPMGWSLDFLQPGPDAWPLAAIVAENGAVALLPGAGGVTVEYVQDTDTRRRHAARLMAAQQRILREVPGATAARDSAGRVTDIAIDHSEFTHLPPAAIAQVVQLMQAEGLTATVSSIHINGWIGTHDKRSGARWMLQRLFGRQLDDELERWPYVGDSTNDQLMFAHCPLSVGVANLQRFAADLHTWPAWLTRAERGAGFAELAARILAARPRPGAG